MESYAAKYVCRFSSAHFYIITQPSKRTGVSHYSRPMSSAAVSGSREARRSSMVGMKRPLPLQFSQGMKRRPEQTAQSLLSPRHPAHARLPLPLQYGHSLLFCIFIFFTSIARTLPRTPTVPPASALTNSSVAAESKTLWSTGSRLADSVGT